MTAPTEEKLKPLYTEEELAFRVKCMNQAKEITYSNQYGMLFLLNEKGEILLNVSRLNQPLTRHASIPEQDAKELADIRKTVAATNIVENEGSTYGMVAGLCDYAESKNKPSIPEQEATRISVEAAKQIYLWDEKGGTPPTSIIQHIILSAIKEALNWKPNEQKTTTNETKKP